jgi:hypothetical protein
MKSEFTGAYGGYNISIGSYGLRNVVIGGYGGH